MIATAVLILTFFLISAAGYAFLILVGTLREYDEDLWEWDDDESL